MANEKQRKRTIYSTKIIDEMINDKKNGYEIDYTPFFEKDLSLRAPNITFEMTEQEYEEYNRCYSDPIYFIENYCQFRVENFYKTVQLRDFQKKIIHMLCDRTYVEEIDTFVPDNKNVTWMAARQSSKTTTTVACLAYKLIFQDNYSGLIAANKEVTANEIVSKLKRVIQGLPYWLKPGVLKFAEKSLAFDNGSTLSNTPTTNTASIGFTLNFLLLDEFAHIPDNICNNFWRSVYPTLSSSRISQCVIISTPNGTTNKFYDIWSKSLTGENSFAHLRTDYWEVPGHDEAWAAQMRKDFGDEEFAQEFELQFTKNSKMIMSSSSMHFTNHFVRDYVQKPIFVSNQYLNTQYLTWHPDFDPNNIDPNDKFIMLVDISEGNGDPDESKNKKEKTPDANTLNIFRVRLNSVANLRRFSENSCKVADCFRFEQVGKFKCSSEDEIYLARVASALSYNLFKDHERDNIRIMVEMNFNGKSFLEEFRRHPLFAGSTILKTYHTKPIPGERQKKKYGFKTTSTRESYCKKGNKLIDKRRVIVTCKETFDQMKAFGYVRGKLKGIACHDDLSMPVFHSIPRMLDESTFITWLQDAMLAHPNKLRVYQLNEIIKQWVVDNPEMSDQEFADMYDLNRSNSTGLDMYGDVRPYILENDPYNMFGDNPYSPGGISLGEGFGGGAMTYGDIMRISR